MTSTTRIILNTLAQNIRTIVNICLSLYSTRLVLGILGQADYGVYMLVAGVVSFLSFFTNAMITTTQRHLSYSYGKDDTNATKSVFVNSYLANTVIGLLVTLVLVMLTSWLFNGQTLNVSPEKCGEAMLVYLIVLASVFFTFITAPFKALFVARENIVYISIVETLDGFLKVGLVFCIELFDTYRIVAYACIISIIMFLNFIAFALYAKLKYEESVIVPDLRKCDFKMQKQLLGFTTWTTYSSICIFLRTQGIAVLLNRAYGTIINASYGIAGQVLGSISFLSTSILNAFTPQIVKAEGNGNRELMIALSLKACKYCYLLMATSAVPVVFEMDAILGMWLGNVPPCAALFCRVFLVSSIIDQITTGLNVTNLAVGKIRNYILLIYTTKLSTLVFVWIGLYRGIELSYILYMYIFVEALTALMRLPYIVKTTGLGITSYLSEVLVPVAIPTITIILVSYGMVCTHGFTGRFIITELVTILFAMISIWIFGLSGKEKEYVRKNILSKILAR